MSSTPGPTSVTMPAPSWPPSTGKPAIGMPPVTRWWSEWHIPAVSIWILTSSRTGSPISISSMDHGLLNSQMRAPFVFIATCFRWGTSCVSNYLHDSMNHPGGWPPGLPDGNRAGAERVVAGQLLAGEAALDALLHAL